MFIVDSQVHIWLSGTPGDTHKPQSRFSAEDLLAEMDQAGVNCAALNAVGWDRGRDQVTMEAIKRGEFDCNETTIDAARRYPDRLAVIFRLAADKPKSADLIPGLLKQPGVIGTRLSFTGHEARWLLDGTADWYWPTAEKYRIPTTVRVTGAKALDHIGTVAERHPGLPIVIDHFGTQHRADGPKGTDIDDSAFAYHPHVLALAKFPNVAVKATAATDYSSHPYPHANIHKYIRETFDHFGPARMFWGSDISRLRGPYRQCVTLFTEELPWLSASDKELIMGKAYCNWFRAWM
jgi:predicted TIM-barrel fold metal-dependent hydrolase